MSERKKKYTEQKIREVADMFNSTTTNPIAVCFCDKDGWKPNYIECHVEAMLRQAADAEEENAQLKARLEAVVKECENLKAISESIKLIPDDFDAILRAARGEGGAA